MNPEDAVLTEISWTLNKYCMVSLTRDSYIVKPTDSKSVMAGRN